MHLKSETGLSICIVKYETQTSLINSSFNLVASNDSVIKFIQTNWNFYLNENYFIAFNNEQNTTF